MMGYVSTLGTPTLYRLIDQSPNEPFLVLSVMDLVGQPTHQVSEPLVIFPCRFSHDLLYVLSFRNALLLCLGFLELNDELLLYLI